MNPESGIQYQVSSIENPTLAHFRHFSSLFTNLPAYKGLYLRAYKAPDIYVPIRHYICRESSTNRPFYAKQTQFPKSQMNVKPYNTSDYENKSNWTIGENKPNSNPIKPNLKRAKMNVNLYVIEDYRKKDDFVVRINKPNFQNAKNERKFTYNKGLQKKRCFRSPKNKPKQSQFLQRPKSPAGKSGHTPAYTVRQLFDIIVLYKYHLPIINPFIPLLGQPNENHP